MITQKRLKELFHYNPETGVFTRRISASSTGRAGSVFGSKFPGRKNVAYLRGKVDGKAHLLHRLAFLYMTGDMPAGVVDHIDGDGLNNAWANLRDVDDTQSARNRSLRVTNKSGVSGVHFHKRMGMWQVNIADGCGGKKTVGSFHDFFEAVCARKSAENDANYHENHGRAA